VSWKTEWWKTAEEQSKVKRMKRTVDSIRDLWENINNPNKSIL